MTNLDYIGNCEWEPSGEPEPHDPPHDLPTTVEPWIGRSDKLSIFLAGKAVGNSYLGGYIIDRRVRDNSPFQGVASAEIIIARPPNFSTSLSNNSTLVQTFEKTAAVTNSEILAGADEVIATRKVSAAVTSTSWSYFASSLPGGARFSSVASGANPRILRDNVTVRASSTAASPGLEASLGSWAGSPEAVRSALDLNIINYAESHTSERIAGTPWYRCVDVCVRGYDIEQ